MPVGVTAAACLLLLLLLWPAVGEAAESQPASEWMTAGPACDSVVCQCRVNSRRWQRNQLICSLRLSGSNRSEGGDENFVDCRSIGQSRQLRWLTSLTVDCSASPACGIVQLSRLIYYSWPLQQLEIFACGVNTTSLDNVDANVEMVVAPFGVTDDGFAGFLLPRPSTVLPTAACTLERISVTNADIIFPRTLPLLCPSLRSVRLVDSRVGVFSDDDLLLASSLRVLSLAGSCLFEFASGVVGTALISLTQFIRHASLSSVDNATLPAVEALRGLLHSRGPFTDIRVLYFGMDSSPVNFSLVAGAVGRQTFGSGVAILDLSGNELSEIPTVVSMLPNLRRLNLSSNRITDLYTSGACWGRWRAPGRVEKQCYWFRASKDSLIEIDLSRNLISEISEVQPWYQTSLMSLNLAHNRIKRLYPLSMMSQLQYNLRHLHLEGNYIDRIELNFMRALELLDLSDNMLTSITNVTVPESQGLQRLIFAQNRICYIQPGVFKWLPSLRVLDLRGNSMTSMPHSSLVTSPRYAKTDRVTVFISNQRQVTECDCQHVYVQTKLEEEKLFPSKYIYPTVPEANEIKCKFLSSTMQYKYAVRVMGERPLSEFGCRYSAEQETLVPPELCAFNTTQQCLTRCNTNCVCWRAYFWFSMNCSGSVSLTRTFVVRAPIYTMELANLQSSMLMRFSNNSIMWDTPKYKLYFHMLYMANSKVIEIEDFAFDGLYMTLIDLDSNKLRSLTEYTFAGLEDKLVILRLTFNQLTTVSANRVFRPLRRLSRLKLRGNPWVCSCSKQHLDYIDELRDYCRYKEVVHDYDQLTCRLTKEFQREFARFDLVREFPNVSFNAFPMPQIDMLHQICQTIQDRTQQIIVRTVKTIFGVVGGLIGCTLLVTATRRRHMLCSLFATSALIQLLLRRRRDSIRRRKFHLFAFSARANEEVLVTVLQELRIACQRVGISIKVCTVCDFHIGDDSMQLCKYESLHEAVSNSCKVLTLLSEEFFRANALEMIAIVDCLGDRLTSDLLILRLNRDEAAYKIMASDVALTARVEEEHRGAGACMKLLLSSTTVQYGSLDWQYQLLRLLMQDCNRGDEAAAAEEEEEEEEEERYPLLGDEVIRGIEYLE